MTAGDGGDGGLDAEVDVVVVGAGPVGLCTAALLGRRGRRVLVLDQRPQAYGRPRAVHVDGAAAAVLAELGADPMAGGRGEPVGEYVWRNADGATLLRFDGGARGPDGRRAVMIHQPALERALADVVAGLDGVRVRRGHRVVRVAGAADHAEVLVESAGRTTTVRAPWVIGCDGANSVVREHMRTTVTDLGFRFDWLIADVVPHGARDWDPMNLQLCDPARPTTAVSGGPGRRRWEFMLMPGETAERMATEESVWELLAPWDLSPGNATLERHAVYTFAARWADDWRDGRLLLAGDAAHLMPPFAGQGLCAGIGDAADLAWKLDLVLSGAAGAALLDTYTAERLGHARQAIDLSVELGRVICVADPAAAAHRDRTMIALGADPARILPPAPPLPEVGVLLHQRPDGTVAEGAGTPLTGPAPGFVLAATTDPRTVLPADRSALLDRIGARTVTVRPGDALHDHLTGAAAVGVLLRPDGRAFGSATDAARLATLVDDLGVQLGTPAPAPAADGPEPLITAFGAAVGRRHGAPHGSYDELWAWSVGHPGDFWTAVWDFFDVRADGDPWPALVEPVMPGARWFPGTRLNYTEHALRHGADDEAAIVAEDETGAVVTLTRGELRAQVAAFADWLRRHGVGRGDRVVGYLPNGPHAVVAFLGCAAVGAVWSACAQDLGGRGAVARFAQLGPVVLVTADGYRFGGRDHDRRGEVEVLRAGLPTLLHTVHVGHLAPDRPGPTGTVPWEETISTPAELRCDRLPFDAPLWVLFSSGTTGAPKGIVHGHGGIVLDHLRLLGLHQDLRPRERFLWHTTTSWVMWNMVVSGLLVGATAVLYDGSPVHPTPERLFELAAAHRLQVLGVSPGYLLACSRAGVDPAAGRDLSALRVLGSTGAPLPATTDTWVRDRLGPTVRVVSSSGGTDVASAFVGSAPTVPTRPGEMAAPLLGVALDVWDAAGRPVVGEVGELVVTAPMPSMPLHFWDDPDGRRHRDAYFSTWPGVWRHGDLATRTASGGIVVSGRSDATLNRHGVRLGSAEVYQVVEELPEVREALIVGAELDDGRYWMPLFVVLEPGWELDGPLRERITGAIRTHASPRHVPDDVLAVPAIPHTRTGKKLEVPVKRLIQGAAPAEVVASGSVDRPELLEFYAGLARPAGSRA